ncbi:unnamed protein product [Kuraishia capsulata CBS 1993]|uniref:Uncharacterized protein n=1 Tax=Kuraishia capsulata CBS 1993 TaxID=1382522 RepID=W6MNC0_9ASCO|nr:uncharacterized protein KUCA_T00004140001 [Kuraishia capsulata CBS 1993]CDK28159.1 unnamed protein product [Kuraishia capsulata CBS 1993]
MLYQARPAAGSLSASSSAVSLSDRALSTSSDSSRPSTPRTSASDDDSWSIVSSSLDFAESASSGGVVSSSDEEEEPVEALLPHPADFGRTADADNASNFTLDGSESQERSFSLPKIDFRRYDRHVVQRIEPNHLKRLLWSLGLLGFLFLEPIITQKLFIRNTALVPVAQPAALATRDPGIVIVTESNRHPQLTVGPGAGSSLDSTRCASFGEICDCLSGYLEHKFRLAIGATNHYVEESKVHAFEAKEAAQLYYESFAAYSSETMGKHGPKPGSRVYVIGQFCTAGADSVRRYAAPKVNSALATASPYVDVFGKKAVDVITAVAQVAAADLRTAAWKSRDLWAVANEYGSAAIASGKHKVAAAKTTTHGSLSKSAASLKTTLELSKAKVREHWPVVRSKTEASVSRLSLKLSDNLDKTLKSSEAKIQQLRTRSEPVFMHIWTKALLGADSTWTKASSKAAGVWELISRMESKDHEAAVSSWFNGLWAGEEKKEEVEKWWKPHWVLNW